MVADSRRRIEAAATQLLARDGYNGMGLKAISQSSGLPYGSIYHHFPGGKEEIAASAITSMGAFFNELLRELFARGATPTAIRTMFAYLADRLEQTNWAEGCPIGTPTLDGAADSDLVRAACDASFEQLIEPVADALMAEHHSPNEARTLAITLISTYEGAAMLARAQRSRAPIDAAQESMVQLLASDRTET
jgi:TetR/AcrR family transcriptional repressor of lmrAB and yxaGH operons